MSTVLEQLRKKQERNEADFKNAQALAKQAASSASRVDAAASATYQQGQQGGTLVEKATSGIYNNPSRKAYYQESKQAQKAEPKKQSIGKTIFDVVDRGAGYFNQGVASTVDFVANALPRVEGALTGEDPGATFTGAVLKPITDLTGKFKDKVDATVQAIDARVQNDTKDSKVAKLAADIGSCAIAAVPNAVLAFMSGGTSAATTLAPQTSGMTAIASAAARKMAASPMFKVSAMQSLGSGYDEAKANGASDAEAMVAATLSTAFNAAVETSGGLEALPGELRGADLSNGKKALQWLTSALDEGKEEVVQSVISGLTEKAVYNKDKALFSATDENAVVNPGQMAKDFGMGAAIGGIMGGGQVLASNAINQVASRNANTNAPQQTQTNTPNEDMAAKIAQGVQKDAAAQPAQVRTPVQVEPPVAKTEDIMPKPVPAVDVDAAVNNVRAEGTGTVGDMGAKTSDFPHEVKKSQSHSIDNREDFFQVPADKRTEYVHDAVTEKESLHNARLRLDQDYEGEQAQLIRDLTWTGEQVDESRMISDDLLSVAMETNSEEAWQEYQDWRKVMKQHGEEMGRGLQALAKYARKTGSKIVELASDALENARPGTDNVDVLNTVADYAKQYDDAVGKKDVDSLVQIIKNTSVTRRTGTFLKGNLPKEVGWALDRIAELAKADLAKTKDANAQQEKPKPVQNYTLKSGDRVTVSNRNNVGTITKVNEDGTYTIHFKAKSGAEATKTFSGDMITKLGQGKPAVSVPANTYEVGRFYDFLENFAAAGVEAIAVDKQKASFGERAKTFRYNAMLSKVSTVLRNLVGNGVFDPVDSVSRNISVLLDMLVSKLTGTRSVAVDKSLFSKDKYTGSMDALAMALLETGLDVNSDGAGSKYERSANRTNKMSGGPIERLMSSWEKWMGYALTVTDETAKGGVSSEVQRGIDRLYEQDKITDDSLRDGGQQEAKYRTFQDDTQLSNALKALRAAGNEIHVGDVGLGDIALPFAQVPANLASRALEYSPAGLAKSAVDLAGVLKKAKAGTLTAAEQAKAVQGIGRGINGTALIGLAATLALKGLIHVENPGDTDENKDKAAMDKASGFSGTQWNLSAMERWARGEDTAYRAGDEMISIGFLDPINAMLVTGALIAEDIQSEETSVGSVLKDSLSGTLQAVGDLPVMQTFQSVGNAFRYSDGDTWGEKAMDAGLQFAADQSTSLIPNALKGIAQGLDPYQRDLYTGDTLGEKTVDAWKASIPGLRNALPIKYDSFGNPMMNEGGVQNFLNTNILPGQVTNYKTNDTIEKLRDLEKRTGKASVYPGSKAPDSVTVDDETIKLSQEQKDQYQQFRGQMEAANREALFADENYDFLTKKMEVKAHKYAEEYANQVAKAGLGIGYEPDNWVTELDGASPEEVAKAIVGKTLDSESGYGDAKKQEAYRKQIYDPTWSTVDGEVLDKAMDYATQFNDAVTKDSMGYEMTAEWMLEAQRMTSVQARTDYFIGKAVETQAKKTEGGKYEGLEQMLKAGEINGEAALLACPDSVVDAYNAKCKRVGVSAEQWIDVYGYANAATGTAEEKREKTLEYISGLKLNSKKKVALGQALFKAQPTFIPKEADLPNDWLLDIGADTSVIVGQFSKSQKEAYSTYIEPAGVDMKHYLDAVEFNGSAKADKDKNGKTISGSKRDKVINYINSMDIDKAWKRAIYLSLGYSAKNMPRNWK